jgi:hypothetical protein
MATNLGGGIPQLQSNFKFSGFEPDADPITPGVMLECENIFATAKGFKPYPDLMAFSSTGLGSPCLGVFSGYLANAPVLVAGTANQLYVFNYATKTWVSQGLSLIPTTGRWRFDIYGGNLIAVNGVNPPEVYTGSGVFTPLGGAPPIASIVQATDYSLFLIVPNSRTWWSSLSATIWTPAVATATVTGSLDTSGGIITAAHKLRDMIVLYKMRNLIAGTFVGPPFYWSFRTVSKQVGVACQEAVANLGDLHYFPGPDNFYRFDGATLEIIPNNLREWFFANLDGDNADKIAARWDESRTIIFWHFASINASPAGSLDKWICYNTRTGQWTKSATQYIDIPIFGPIKASALTYGSFTTTYPTYGAVPNITYGSLRPQSKDLSAVIGTDHFIQAYNATPVASSITTNMFGDRHNIFLVSRLRPQFSLYPASAIVSVVKQYTPGLASPPSTLMRPISSDGWFNVMTTARLQKFKMDMGGDHEILGIEAMVDYAGER